MSLDTFDFLGILSTFGDYLSGKRPNIFEEEEVCPKEIEPFILKKPEIKKYNYRPETLEEYISQENAKSLIRLLIKETLEIGKYRHVLISGTRGHGKTTLARVLCKHLGFELNYFIANSFTKEHLKDFLIKNEKASVPQVLMLDEVHVLKKTGEDAVGYEFFYPILEDGVLPNTQVKLKPFILVGATTDLEFLQTKYPAFVDRFLNIELVPYTSENIKKILLQYNQVVYQKAISDEDMTLLACNARNNPRTAILLFDLYIASGNVREVLRCNGIIKNGLTDRDITVLEHLAEINKPVGVEALAIIAHTDVASFKCLIEPYILQQGYTSRTSRGRILTLKGQMLLRSLK